MLVQAKWLLFLDSLVAANQKLLARSDQSRSRDRLLDPSNVTELREKLLVLVVA